MTSEDFWKSHSQETNNISAVTTGVGFLALWVTKSPFLRYLTVSTNEILITVPENKSGLLMRELGVRTKKTQKAIFVLSDCPPTSCTPGYSIPTIHSSRIRLPMPLGVLISPCPYRKEEWKWVGLSLFAEQHVQPNPYTEDPFLHGSSPSFYPSEWDWLLTWRSKFGGLLKINKVRSFSFIGLTNSQRNNCWLHLKLCKSGPTQTN